MAALSRAHLVVPDLAPAFHGYTIAALGDLHHAPHNELGWLRHAVEAVNAVSPDLVVLLGDYGESFRRAPVLSRRLYRGALAEMTNDLARMRAHDGVMAVLGNHDYYADANIVSTWLEHQVGAEVLVNRARHIARPGGALRIAGLDDVREGRCDPLAGCDPTDRTPTIVFSHNPDGVFHLEPRLRVDGLVAGHTHGGQILIPGYGALVTMARACGRRSASGWIANSRTALYVTRGLGEQLPIPTRINCPPEILVLQLRSGSQQPA